MALLIILDGRGAGRQIPIESDRFIIGRQTDCDLYEPFADESRVSRRHACIICLDDKYFVQDLNSRNGTYLNGERLTARTKLTRGDYIRVNDIGFRFLDSEEKGSHLSSIDDVRFDETDDPHLDSVISLSDVQSDLSVNPSRKLQSLVGLLNNLGCTLDEDAMLRQLLEGLFEVFPRADRGLIALVEGSDDEVAPCIVVNRTDQLSAAVHLSRTLTKKVLEEQQAILSADALTDNRFAAAQSISEARIRSLMCVPLTDPSGQRLGIIQLDTIAGRGQFDFQDLEVLASITPHAATSIGYSRLHAAAIARERLERDLQLARKVQQSLLPERLPQLEGYQFHAYYQAADQVGGDYYDYIFLPKDRLAVVVADVVGKGMPAAMLTAKIAGEWKYLLANEGDPSAAVTCMNDSFHTGHRSHFVTLALVVIDLPSHKLTIVNAGHPSPILRRVSGEVEKVGEYGGGTPVGMLPDEDYEPVELQLEAGESLFLFTDGLTEASKADRSLYGSERLLRQLSAGPADLESMVREVLSDVERFVEGHPQSDDICISCIRRVAP